MAIEAAIQALQQAQPHTEGRRLKEDKAALADQADRLLAGEGSSRHAELAGSLNNERRRQSPPAAAYDEQLSTKGREARWAGALEAVAYRLRGESVPKPLRDHYSRVKESLNAAVNGTRHAVTPVEPTDAGDFFTRLRDTRRESVYALVAADRLSGDALSRPESPA